MDAPLVSIHLHPAQHHSMDPDASTENSCKLSTKILTGTKGKDKDTGEVIFKFQFVEKCRWASCSSDGEPAVVVRESEFPVEQKVFKESMRRIVKPETSKEAIRSMLCELCLAPMSREYFVREISSYAEEEVEKAICEGTGRLAIVVEMVAVTTLPAKDVEKSTPSWEEEWSFFAIDDDFCPPCCFW